MEVQYGFFFYLATKFSFIVGSIKTWDEQTRFYFSKYLVVLIINLVSFVHGYSQLISLEVIVVYWKLSFQETQANSNRLLEQPYVKLPIAELLNRISWAKLRNYSEDLRSCWTYSIIVVTTNFSKNHRR